MTNPSSEQMFRQAAEAEGGMRVSAGARVAQVRMAVETGRAFFVDLSRIPEDKRPMLIAEIHELVDRAGASAPNNAHNDAADISKKG